MIRFNRAIHTPKVLSFDLDDTLYNNHPIIKSALDAQQQYLNTLPAWREQPKDFWLTCRSQVIKAQPELVHDVTALRQHALRHAMKQIKEDEQHADLAYQAFADARSKVNVSESVLTLLARLSKHFKLIAITNGNVEVSRFNLKDQFEFVLLAGPDGRAKPYPDLFNLAAKKLNIESKDIMHIGDSLDTDVQGANCAGCQSVWLNNQGIEYRYKGLADMEITDIHELKTLVP